MGIKPAPVAVRFDLQLPSVQQIDTVINMDKQQKQVKYQLVSLPLYLVERLEDIANSFR